MMRRLPKRPDLPADLTKRLRRENTTIAKSPNPTEKANTRYASARDTNWFEPVVTTLRTMSGPGECCMWCSRNEASQVEHYRPKVKYPNLTFAWENLLWSCGRCNDFKGTKFPEDDTKQLVNPVDEDVWAFFFIDEFGLLTAKWRADLEASDPRAESTLAIVNLDRQQLQESRGHRLRALRSSVSDHVKKFEENEISADGLREFVEVWRAEPFQPDVADFFLNGPGREEEPFRRLFEILSSET